MNENKDRIISIAGTVGFHILLVIFLLFYYIKPASGIRWSEELEGVPVMFGNVADAYGDDEPFGRGNNGTYETTDSQEAPNEVTTSNNQQATSPNSGESSMATQDFEETVSIKKADKAEEDKIKRNAIEATERERKAEAARLAAIEEERNKINNQMVDLFGNGSGSGSRGNTEGTGTQGVPTGNASYGKTSGIGGWGEYDLGGRGVGRGGLVKPSYTANDYGTVVIDIIVDPSGNVVSADIGRGTNTPSSKLKTEALSAARRTKFSPTDKPGNQKGTITYKFNLN